MKAEKLYFPPLVSEIKKKCVPVYDPPPNVYEIIVISLF
jgi:hypothetical protein